MKSVTAAQPALTALNPVSEPNYAGEEGLAHIRTLQKELIDALREEDWLKVQRLDRSCAALVSRVVAANRDNGTTLALALAELKGVYANLISQCRQSARHLSLPNPL